MKRIKPLTTITTLNILGGSQVNSLNSQEQRPKLLENLITICHKLIS